MQTHRKSASHTVQTYDFLVPERGRRQAFAPRPAEIEDAVFEIVAARPQPRVRTNDNVSRSPNVDQPDILPFVATLGGRLAACVERQLSKLSPQAFVTLLSSLFIAVFWLCGGFSALGAQGGPVLQERHPFELGDTFIATEDANGMKIATITGTLVNMSPATIDAPRLRIVSGARREQLGILTLPVDEIGPNMAIPFSGRFKLAGGKSADIAIIPERS